MNIYTGRPNIPDPDAFLARAKEILENRRLTNNGPMVRELEERLSEYLNVKHVVAVCNGTIGLMVAVKSLGLSGEVILPSFTFAASAHALQWEGLKPVFCDIDPRTHNIDASKIEKLITDKTSAIMGVHVWGRPCPHDELSAICDKHGLRLLYDAANAFGSTYKSRSVAALEEVSVLSFHATKSFNTFEGGAIVTDDDEIARNARLLRNFFFEGEDNVAGLGINAKMSEIHAAMGLCNMESYPGVLAHNKNVYLRYKENLSGVRGVSMLDYPDNENNSYHYIVTEIDESFFGHSRDAVYEWLRAKGILARRYFYPGCHNSEPYKSLYPGIYLPCTEALCKKALVLPGGSGIDEIGQVDDVVSLIANIRD